jgi:hypothetical protein
MRPVVYIHTNDKQMLGARVGAYLLKARSRTPDAFDVRLLRLEETPHLNRREGQTYLRKGKIATWRNDDLQSFSPLRMMVPQLRGFRGRALVIDPDVFAIGDVCEFLMRDMERKAILCRHVQEGYRGNGSSFYASSVMLLDCAKLTHWQWDQQIDDIFAKRLDYGPWIGLLLEDPSTIGEIEEEWNHFDKLTLETKLLHNTERSTQPWKTGLPVDYDTTIVTPESEYGWIHRKLIRWGLVSSTQGVTSRYAPHPDPKQELFFLTALKECLSNGVFDESFLKEQMEKKYARPDLLEKLGELESGDVLV